MSDGQRKDEERGQEIVEEKRHRFIKKNKSKRGRKKREMNKSENDKITNIIQAHGIKCTGKKHTHCVHCYICPDADIMFCEGEMVPAASSVSHK